MKNTKEAEAESGINKQNIRYYEKMGLIHPDRNTINGYRKYSEEDMEISKGSGLKSW
ncbi:MerR family DNA-binding transcriptional regulator [bacterium]|nr:MerR family DNA-binding transcriptional regulator [bacterium]